MKLYEFLNSMRSKIPSGTAFDFVRNARLDAIEKILIEKKIVTAEEIAKEQEIRLDEAARTVNESLHEK